MKTNKQKLAVACAKMARTVEEWYTEYADIPTDMVRDLVNPFIAKVEKLTGATSLWKPWIKIYNRLKFHVEFSLQPWKVEVHDLVAGSEEEAIQAAFDYITRRFPKVKKIWKRIATIAETGKAAKLPE